MEDDGYLQVGFFRHDNALRYWIDDGYGEEFDAAWQMLLKHGRKIEMDLARDSFVFDDTNQELFFKLRFSDAFMADEQFPWMVCGDDDWDCDYDYREWHYSPEPVHDRFFIPAKVKLHYGLGFD
jgi:hypothetical protein